MKNPLNQFYQIFIIADERLTQLCHSEIERQLLPPPTVVNARSFSPDLASKSILILQLEQMPAQKQLVSHWLKKDDRAVICISSDILDAYKSWMLGASDFILSSNPGKLDIVDAVKKVSKILRAQLLLLDESETVQFPVGNCTVSNIQVQDIQYIEASGDYCWCFTKSKKVAIHLRLGACENILNSFGFQRIHRSLFVNPRNVKLRHGKSLIMSNGLEVTIAKRRSSSRV